jgi:hypothetical protein
MKWHTYFNHVQSFMHPFCSWIQQAHTLNKVQYPASGDVLKVTKNMQGHFKYFFASTTDCLPAPTLNRCPPKGQYPVSSPITLLSWFLLTLSNLPSLFAQVLLRKPLACLCPWVNYQCSSSFLLVQSLIRGRDSKVTIATRYGLDGPGIESW